MVTATHTDAGPAGPARTAQHSAALGAPASNLLGDLHALAMMGEHLARSLRGVFEPFLRRAAKLQAEPIRIVRFEDYQDGRGDRLAAHVPLGMAPLQGHALAVLDGALVVEATDLFFGGTGQAVAMPAEFAPSGETIALRIVAGMAERMAAAWAELATIRFTPGKLEAQAAMVGGFDADDRLVLTRFQLQLTETRRTAVDILYPVAALKPIAPALCAKVAGRRADGGDPAWNASLTRAVMNVPFEVRSVLAEPTIPLAQLMALKPGDIIPITFGPEVPLIVASNRFATGSVGAANGHAAVRVARVETPQIEDLP